MMPETCPRVVGSSDDGKRIVLCGVPMPCIDHPSARADDVVSGGRASGSVNDCPNGYCIKSAGHLGEHLDARDIPMMKLPPRPDTEWNLKPLVPWWHRARRPKVRPIFAWYDLWVGVFVDRPKRRVYVFPLPCIGLVVSW